MSCEFQMQQRLKTPARPSVCRDTLLQEKYCHLPDIIRFLHLVQELKINQRTVSHSGRLESGRFSCCATQLTAHLICPKPHKLNIWEHLIAGCGVMGADTDRENQQAMTQIRNRLFLGYASGVGHDSSISTEMLLSCSENNLHNGPR